VGGGGGGGGKTGKGKEPQSQETQKKKSDCPNRFRESLPYTISRTFGEREAEERATGLGESKKSNSPSMESLKKALGGKNLKDEECCGELRDGGGNGKKGRGYLGSASSNEGGTIFGVSFDCSLNRESTKKKREIPTGWRRRDRRSRQTTGEWVGKRKKVVLKGGDSWKPRWRGWTDPIPLDYLKPCKRGNAKDQKVVTQLWWVQRLEKERPGEIPDMEYG